MIRRSMRRRPLAAGFTLPAFFLCLGTLVTGPAHAATESLESANALRCMPRQPVSDFRGRGLEGWDARSFSGETRYALVETKESGDRSGNGAPGSGGLVPGHSGDDRGTVLEAVAEDAASGLFRELDVDLDATPVLRWSWSVEAPVAVDDVRTRSGDDFAARVYVVFSGGMAFWRTTSLVYVWADDRAPEGFWSNPFTENARMLAVNRGAADDGWSSVGRNIVDDYRTAFRTAVDAAPPPIAAVAIMTDTDQTGSRAVARYGDLWFEGETARLAERGATNGRSDGPEEFRALPSCSSADGD